jgi:gamma-glutamyltranspeptidase/glutathione hydrolase
MQIRKRLSRSCAAIVLASALPALAQTAATGAPASAQSTAPGAPAQPEAESGRGDRAVVRTSKWMAVTAHRLATQAAREMLERGGSAVDAAIAAQMMLTLVEPQSSGLGGGGFLLHHDPASGRIDAWDGRETAPQSITDKVFIGTDGKPKRFHDAAVGGLAVGVPGLVAMLASAHAEHGRLAWADLFQPAIRQARGGFPVSERLHTLIARDRFLKQDHVARAHFYDAEGQPRAVGEILRNPALAATLEVIARDGPSAFYRGPIAEEIVRRVREHPGNPGLLTLDDLSRYRAIRREPLCMQWLRFEICGMPPPSSGAIAVAQILGLFAVDPGARLTLPGDAVRTVTPATASASAAQRTVALASASEAVINQDGVHRFLEAARLAFADRDHYVGDPDFVSVPVGALVAQPYLRARASLIGERAAGRAQPGDPLRGLARIAAVPRVDLERESTTHLSIVDAAGRAVSMTTSIEDAFGARLMVRGFLLNNQLTDFSFAPERAGHRVANRVEPGKRPRSSMAPTLVFERAQPERRNPDQGGARSLVLAIGSPGGASIIAYVARTLQMSLAEGVQLQQAIAAGHFGNRNGPSEVEALDGGDALARALEGRGHQVRRSAMTSGLHGIIRVCAPGVGQPAQSRCWLESGTDPRREGQATGG